jgi:hypothetical protein
MPAQMNYGERAHRTIDDDQLPAAELNDITAGRINETANITKRVFYLVRDGIPASANLDNVDENT